MGSVRFIYRTRSYAIAGNYCLSRNLVSTNSIAPCSVYKPYTTHNSSIRSDEGLTLETSAFQSLYGGQFTLSTLLINQIFVYPCKHPRCRTFGHISRETHFLGPKDRLTIKDSFTCLSSGLIYCISCRRCPAI